MGSGSSAGRVVSAVLLLAVCAMTFGIGPAITVAHALGLIALGLAIAIAV